MGRSRATPACLQRFDVLGAESAGHSLTMAVVAPRQAARAVRRECWCERRSVQRRPLSRQTLDFI